jgi:lipid-binding SYLF domain-containing protein
MYVYSMNIFIIHCVGLGWGFQAGGELTDFILVLSTSGITATSYVTLCHVIIGVMSCHYIFICV